MDPVCFTLFGRPIYWYGLLLALGFGAGLLHLAWLDRRDGRPPGFASDLLFWVILGGIAGARAAYVFGNWRAFAETPGLILRVDKGGLVFYGGFFGAAAAAALFARRRQVALLPLFDALLSALPLGHAFGRIGCFINGCCHGAPHEGSLACVYPRHSPAWWSQFESGRLGAEAAAALPVWPVQLFEAAANVLLYLLFLLILRRRPVPGTLLALYFFLYPAIRFGLEFLRGDQADRVVFQGLTSAQWVSLALAAFALLFVLLLRIRHAHPHRPA